MTRHRTFGQRVYNAGAGRRSRSTCRRCGAPIRWAAETKTDGSLQWHPFDIAENPKAAWALDGGQARRTFMAWPGANFTRHDRHECPEEAPCPPAA